MRQLKSSSVKKDTRIKKHRQHCEKCFEMSGRQSGCSFNCHNAAADDLIHCDECAEMSKRTKSCLKCDKDFAPNCMAKFTCWGCYITNRTYGGPQEHALKMR